MNTLSKYLLAGTIGACGAGIVCLGLVNKQNQILSIGNNSQSVIGDSVTRDSENITTSETDLSKNSLPNPVSDIDQKLENGEDLDCSDFTSQQSAQEVFDYIMNKEGYDAFALDGDSDDFPCETLL